MQISLHSFDILEGQEGRAARREKTGHCCSKADGVAKAWRNGRCCATHQGWSHVGLESKLGRSIKNYFLKHIRRQKQDGCVSSLIIT